MLRRQTVPQVTGIKSEEMQGRCLGSPPANPNRGSSRAGLSPSLWNQMGRGARAAWVQDLHVVPSHPPQLWDGHSRIPQLVGTRERKEMTTGVPIQRVNDSPRKTFSYSLNMSSSSPTGAHHRAALSTASDGLLLALLLEGESQD